MPAPVRTAERDAAVRDLADRVVALQPGERVTVAVDGFDGAGKTVLADEVAQMLMADRPVLRVSIDGFHRPQAQRRARGRGPESFYEDSYDYDAFRRAVIEPFRRGAPVTPAINDVVADRPIHPDRIVVGPGTVLLVDGIFLQRPELTDAWDATVWVDVPFAVSVPRGNARFEGEHDPDPEAAVNRRYVEGQRLYLAEARPREQASWVFDNTDLARPLLTSGRLSPPG
ncbi:uridine kinase [Humibacillus sp. DSM 29435]|uniref:uridine kinase n=1 Tax=Humibacillus sp. DSM 29435 TaxID=1869167 RepID=UPI0008733A70|nr:uridine kinase [Humibacillus sp. DSM 29435]OFE16623.1 uridine kinase [Humibacillus sp. DSM 29435]